MKTKTDKKTSTTNNRQYTSIHRETLTYNHSKSNLTHKTYTHLNKKRKATKVRRVLDERNTQRATATHYLRTIDKFDNNKPNNDQQQATKR